MTTGLQLPDDNKPQETLAAIMAEKTYLASPSFEKGKYDSHGKPSSDFSTSEFSHSLLQQDARKLEAQVDLPPTQRVPAERQASLSKKLVFLASYFFLNLSLTVSNKAILGKAHFPWLLTTLHASVTSIGCFGMMGSGYLKVKRLNAREGAVLTAFSFLFTLNIAISNVSLDAVSLPFHQIMRSTCPVITIFIYRSVYGRTYSTQTYLSMIPLILGVALATAGDYYATLTGVIMTLMGVVLASVKTVATNRLITGAFWPMEVLLLMSPLATTQCVVYAFMTGEVYELRVALANGAFPSPTLRIGLIANACIALALNIVSFQANKVAGALTISVCGNVKQALTIALALLSAGILGYPSPVIINWNQTFDDASLVEGGSHLAKIAGVNEYVSNLGPEHDEDLVLMVDGYDIWLQLRPQTLVDRYFDINRRADERIRKEVGPAVAEKHNIRHEIIFGCQKRCWPWTFGDPPCYAVPNSSLPKDIYGPQTDTPSTNDENPYNNYRQRFLNSGMGIGTVRAMRKLFGQAFEQAQVESNIGSDQYIFSRIFGDQEIWREAVRRDSLQTTSSLAKQWMSGHPKDFFPQQHLEEVRKKAASREDGNFEFGIGLDYGSEIVLNTVFAEDDTEWLYFNDSSRLQEAEKVHVA
ncbi:hypothetical protein B0A55_10723 [Friedmanniomyces simplex]|uniref:Sugar phosphate transporter domain-containing protein n=1 Tax=Friedmanniomyces simplex TaxID=329884 RepID=A0A4V5NEE2_9PEZI|nr:hypothetical protein B0A55_10723 [Friedmanniomyces simplex]